MKKISLFLFVLMATFGMSRAQFQLFINGDVNNNGTPLIFQSVIIALQSGGAIFMDSTFTDSAGQFSYTTTISNFLPQGVAIVSTPGCNGGWVSDSSGYWAGNNNLYFSLNTCAGGSGGPVCSAQFWPFPVGLNSFAFFSDTLANWNATYSWSFGDGTASSSMIPQHTYANPGTYLVCLTVTDTINSCTDTFCDSLIVGQVLGCQAGFVATNLQSTVVSFTNLSSGSNPVNPLFYSWSFGDGGSSSQMNPVHAYNAAGNYTVCLYIYDSSGCADSTCQAITVGNSGSNCQANFAWSSNALGLYSFTNLSTGGSPASPLSYFWDFGDSTFSTLQNPTHTFVTPGPWSVCLTVYDSLGNCTSTYCQLILGQNTGAYSVSGWVFADSSTMIYDGVAYLIVHDSLNGTLTAIDTVNILQSFYHFANVTPGTYLVKAALLPTSPDYAAYLPTYLGDELFWSNATSTIVTNINLFNPPILLVQGTNPGGPGFIGGLISQGANKGPGDPLSDISVLLMHNDGSPSGHAVTDANGEFSFSNLAYGTYKVHVEVAGKHSDEWTVVIGGTSATFETANFEVGSTQIHAVGATAIDRFAAGEVLAIFPVPASETLNVNLSFSAPVNLRLSLVNIMGQTVTTQTEGRIVGTQEISLDVRNLSPGTYLLRIQADEQVITRRVVVK
ncbi:MAG: PKD domain-containing protein [Bacteroidia bacterium]|nr:PKD domain-containing protein [Bacteroidia bacterium]